MLWYHPITLNQFMQLEFKFTNSLNKFAKLLQTNNYLQNCHWLEIDWTMWGGYKKLVPSILKYFPHFKFAYSKTKFAKYLHSFENYRTILGGQIYEHTATHPYSSVVTVKILIQINYEKSIKVCNLNELLINRKIYGLLNLRFFIFHI